jgi:hypothetical protein
LPLKTGGPISAVLRQSGRKVGISSEWQLRKIGERRRRKSPLAEGVHTTEWFSV